MFAQMLYDIIFKTIWHVPYRFLVNILFIFILFMFEENGHANENDSELNRPFTVFAAASLVDVMKHLIDHYEVQSGSKNTILSVAGTATLARQIENGAPVDIFISADRLWIDYLINKEIINAEAPILIARNRLALVTDKTVVLTGTLKHRILEITQKDFLAIADSKAIPAGRYAKAALLTLGIWNDIQTSLVQTDNVRVAVNFVLRGEADGAIIYMTDALVYPDLKIQGIFSPKLHPPIEYWAVPLNGASQNALNFLDSFHNPYSLKIFKKHGFLWP